MRDTFFDIDMIAGLTDEQAQERLAAEGFNELPSSRRRGLLSIAASVVKEPMFLLLVACGAVYMAVGDFQEALMLLGFVAVIMGITIAQERRTERALEALRDLSSPRALVVRSGRQKRIPGREVVRGDMIILTEGDRVPADAVVRQCMGLTADESLLTGESAPVHKAARASGDALDAPGGEGLASVFSGSLITGGQAAAQVVAVGTATQMGQIGKALQTIEPQQSPLQRQTARLVRMLAVVGLSLCAAVVLIYALMRGGSGEAWKNGLLAGLTLAMATLPEEFPVVLTIFLAMGAWRISRHGVLTRRTAAVETLGATTVLCVDKTGTLTQNRMSISKLWTGDDIFDLATPHERLPERFHRLLEFGVLASKKDPFDPMDKALKALGQEYLARTEHLHESWRLVHEYPLSGELLALSHAWASPDGKRVMIAAKGAPEAVADLCHMEDHERSLLAAKVAAMADQGLRVLGVARGLPAGPGDLPGRQHDFDFEFLGLVGLADPVRPTVAGAIEQCRHAGIRVIMITGDYPGTAANIARQIGMDAGEILTGAELEAMSDADLQRRIATTNIVARAVPQHKLRIVNALKAGGEIVAMTGDGVNDAPALKAAHIGLAMGERGTDVAREASSLVLLDDDFTSIVHAVRLGRRIFDNIKKAVAYIFAIHVPIAGLSLVPLFFTDLKQLILMPVHILFLELIIDPSCTMIFEAEAAEPDVMSRRPRNPNEPLFSLRALGLSLLQGLVVLAIMLGVFVVARWMGHSEDNARGLTFTALVVANLSLILTNRSWTRTAWSMFKVRNRAAWFVTAGAAACLALVLFVPPLRLVFHFAPPHTNDLLICLAAGALSIAWFEIVKILRRRRVG
ncbi:MAG: cation-translocating P-type ATPase [Planctomycetaceae bacterium]|nr:cation-translocating P-type ATPase [Planctomycetaceae bacterium]